MSTILNKEIIIGVNNVDLVESYMNNCISTPLIRKKTINTKDYINNLFKKVNGKLGVILPRNCRFVLPINSKTSIIVVEDQPKLRSIRFFYNFDRERELVKVTGQDLNITRFLKGQSEPYNLKLSFPYIVYVIMVTESESKYTVNKFNVFFRRHPISRINDYLNIANIFNLSDTNTLCFGRGNDYNKDTTLELSDLINYMITDFWNKPFTDEYQSRHYMYQNHPRLHSFLVWAHYSEIDPLFIYSTNWVMHVNNLQQEINNLINSQQLSYSTIFSDIFIKSMNIIPDDDNRRKYTYENLTLVDQVLSLGDQIRYNEQDLYLYNLIGNKNEVTHAVLTDVQGNHTELIELTDEIKEDWKIQSINQLNNYVDEIQFGNKTIKIGDIVKIIPNNSFEIVKKIRLTRDKQYELVLDKRFYIIREDTFEVIDSFNINGIELIHNSDYLVCNNQHQIAFKGKMLRIENNNHGILYFFFRDLETGDERGISVESLEENDILVYHIDDPNIINPYIFRYLNKLYTNNNHKYIIIKGKGIYTDYLNNNDDQSFPSEYNPRWTIENILSEDKQSLFIYGVDIDIEFKVGDEIIISDWNNPDEWMFKIRKIIGFEYNDTTLNFIVVDSDGHESSIEYLYIQSGKVMVGYIRKVKSEYDNIVIGSIAKSIVSGFFNFPKRTNHEISAIIIDSEKPMVLFKDGLTIWFDDLRENFEIISPESDEYKRIRSIRSFTMDNIPWQSGDICKKGGNLYIMNDGNEYLGLIYMEINSDFIKTGSLRSGISEISNGINPDFSRYGILNPRYRKNNSVVVHETIPDFHNGYINVPYDGYYPFLIPKTQEVNE